MKTRAPKSILILGAGSDIGQAIAHRYAKAGASLILAAHSGADLERQATDLTIRYGTKVDTVVFDIMHPDPGAFLDGLPYLCDTAVCVVGLLGEQQSAQSNPAEASSIMEVNYVGPARFIGEIADRMAFRRSGTIIGISSVAGDRGRVSNYLYGSAKAGFTAFLSGLRARGTRHGFHVITVKPGPVRTKMTAGMQLPPLLTAEPQEVAEAVFAADLGKHNVVYVRRVWFPVMLLIRALPEILFKRLAL